MKNFTKFMFAVLVALASSVSTFAYKFEVDGFYYNILSEEENTCEVTYRFSYIQNYDSGEIIIPSTVEYKGKTYTVTRIGEIAFANHYKKTSVVIPNTVTEIGDRAFSYSKSLKSVEMPSTLTVIGDNPFVGCQGLTEILLPENENYLIDNGCLVSKDEILVSALNLETVKIPDYVTKIGASAFEYCQNLVSVEIPNTVTEIGDRAFYSIKIASVEIPNSVTSIGKEAFSQCSALRNVKLNEGITSIGESAFYSSGITSIELPSSLTWLGRYAFVYCYLNEIVSLSVTPPSSPAGPHDDPFPHTDKKRCVLKVPNESIEAYKSAKWWEDFYKIEGINITTGISNPTANAIGKSGKSYNLQGMEVEKDSKGIVISNGKKFVVK